MFSTWDVLNCLGFILWGFQHFHTRNGAGLNMVEPPCVIRYPYIYIIHQMFQDPNISLFCIDVDEHTQKYHSSNLFTQTAEIPDLASTPVPMPRCRKEQNGIKAKEIEVLWKASAVRAEILSTMPEHEQKRRRYIQMVQTVFKEFAVTAFQTMNILAVA